MNQIFIIKIFTSSYAYNFIHILYEINEIVKYKYLNYIYKIIYLQTLNIKLQILPDKRPETYVELKDFKLFSSF